MTDVHTEKHAISRVQARRARRLFAEVVLAALDEAIEADRGMGIGGRMIEKWARSQDGKEILLCAGIPFSERVVEGLKRFVEGGVPVSVALTEEQRERDQQKKK